MLYSKALDVARDLGVDFFRRVTSSHREWRPATPRKQNSRTPTLSLYLLMVMSLQPVRVRYWIPTLPRKSCLANSSYFIYNWWIHY